MKSLFKLGLVMLALMMVLAACGTGTNETPNNQDQNQGQTGEDPVDENDVSPTDDEEGEGTTQTVTLYFSDNELMNVYRVQKEITVADGEQAEVAALQAWIKGPDEEGLTNLLPPDVVVEYVEDKDGVAHVSFSREILNANLGSGGEAFLITQIVMIMEQFGYEQTQILVEGEIVESLLGHVETGKPVQAQNPEDFEQR